LIEISALVCIVLIPALMQPVSAAPFEPIKVMLFYLMTAVMLGALIMPHLLAFLQGKLRARPQTEPQTSGKERADSDNPAESSGRERLRFDPLLLPLSAYGVISLLATGLSIDPRLSFWGTPDDPVATFAVLVGCVFCILLSQALRTPDQIERVRKGLIIGSVPVLVYGLVQYVGLDPFRWVSDEASPVHSTLGRSNFLGSYLAMVIPFTVIPLVYSKQRLHRWRWWLLVVLQVLCLVLTLSRGAWLAFCLGLTMSFAALAYRWRIWRLLSLAMLFLAIGILGVILFTVVRFPFRSATAIDQVEGLSYSEVRVISVDQRFVLWQRTAALVPSRWVLGYGPRTFEQVNASQSGSGAGNDVTWAPTRDTHNLLLSHLVEKGVLGLGALLVCLVMFFRYGWRACVDLADRHMQAMALAALFSVFVFIIQAQFNPSVLVHHMVFWVSLALGSALYRLSLINPADNAGRMPQHSGGLFRLERDEARLWVHHRPGPDPVAQPGFRRR
jgi:O-antigen ligase